MQNHILHSSQIIGDHNQSHLLPQSLVSSAKLISLDADTSLSISEIIIKNRRGPETVPCETPLNTGLTSLIPTSNRAKNIQIPKLPVIPTALQKDTMVHLIKNP